MARRVDFYVLTGEQRGARFNAACRVAEKAWRASHRVFVHTEDTLHAREFDSLLWTFKQSSFVPHTLAPSDNLAEVNEVVIGAGEPPAAHFDVLVNVTQKVPDFYTEFPRVAEFVSSDADSKTKGRERFRVYRDDGCEIQSHNV